MSRYAINIYWSNADKAFIAVVPELPGCRADGKTHVEAVENAKVVIREWIVMAKELGRAIPKAKAG